MTKDWFDYTIAIINVCVLVVTGYFIYRSIYSPVDAVRIGRDLNREQQKDNAKRGLFLSLFSLRGNPLHYDFVRGLNQIEVVFEDVPQVISAWRSHFASLQLKDQANAQKNWEIERAALLSAMAVHLGYSNISHGELLRDYWPEGHSDQIKDDLDFRKAALTFYRSSSALSQRMMDRMDDQDNNPEEHKE